MDFDGHTHDTRGRRTIEIVKWRPFKDFHSSYTS